MPKPDDKVRAYFVKKALVRESGTGPKTVGKILAGSGSKMLHSPSSQMSSPEISKDVSYYNINLAQAGASKKMVSATKVEDLAYQYQSEHMRRMAVEEEDRFHRQEEEREKAINVAHRRDEAMEQLEKKIVVRKILDTKRLKDREKKPGTAGGDEIRVKDMPIG